MQRISFLTVGLIVWAAAYVLVGCAGSGATSSEMDKTAEPDSAAYSGPNLQLLKLTSSGVQYVNLLRDESTHVVAADSYLGGEESPDGRYLALAYTAGDSSRLAVIDLNSLDVRPVHAAAGHVVYSLSWAPDGDAVAFGYYRAAGGDEMGAGEVLTAPVSGDVRSVGCQAATKVLKWLPDGNLAVRDSENLYVVESDGCGTVSSLDIRKMYHITYSPDGRRMAYIFRDLVYDRENTEYVPDSSLYVANTRGANKNEIFGDAYRARHLQWSPDGSRLAFDVRSKDDRSRRQIIVYDAGADRLTYLIPPQMAGSRGEVQPRWSPSGDHIAFVLVDGESRHAAVKLVDQTRTFGELRGPVLGWAGRDRIFFSTGDSTRVVSTAGTEIHRFAGDERMVHAWPVSDDGSGAGSATSE